MILEKDIGFLDKRKEEERRGKERRNKKNYQDSSRTSIFAFGFHQGDPYKGMCNDIVLG